MRSTARLVQLPACFFAVCLALLFVAPASAQEQVNREHKETLLAPFPPEVYDSTLISDDARDVAYVTPAPGGQHLVLNGKAQKIYQKIAAVTFSPRGAHLAYAASTGSQWLIVLDGVEQEAYQQVGSPVFSPDGKRLAYVAMGSDQKRVVVVDGKPGEAWDRISGGLIEFSPDSRRVAYGAVRNDQCYLVVDGKAEGPYPDLGTQTGYIFSPDGRRLAFVTRQGEKLCVVLDGQKQAAVDDVGELVFSADGQHVAYAARQGDKWVVMVDEKPSPPYLAVGEGSLAFSPVGTRLAYAAQLTGGWAVVDDGKPQPVYKDIGRILFSPNGKRLAYKAVNKDGLELVVVDGVPQPAFDRVGDGTLVFSTDSRRLGYVAKTVGVSREHSFVVIDGKRRRRYPLVGYLTFAPDNRTPVYVAMDEKRAFTVVEEAEATHRYEGIWNVREERLLFDGPSKFHYLGVKEGSIFLVEESIFE